MALTDENGMNTTMLVSPAGGVPYYGGGNNGGFGNWGGDGWWIILLLLFAGGWGNNGFGGNNGGNGFIPYAVGYNNGCGCGDVQRGFDQAAIMSGIGDINAGINGIQNSLCNGFAGVNQTVSNGFAQAEIAANSRQMANMNQNFQMQSAFADCCCENRLGLANLGSDIAREACATRTADTQNTQSILNVINSGIQSIKDQLCSDKIDAKNDEISQLRQELLYARGQASQDVQTAALRQSDAQTANQLLAEMRSCPIPSMPVYGQTPIFTCPQNQNSCGCGCGCGM